MTGLWIIGLLLITPINIPLQKKEAVKRADDILIPIFFVAVLWTTMRCMPLNTLNWEKSTVA